MKRIVILTLMRTSASMIEVKVCNSASAMLPLYLRLCSAASVDLVYGGEAGDRVVSVAPTLGQTYRPGLTGEP